MHIYHSFSFLSVLALFRLLALGQGVQQDPLFDPQVSQKSGLRGLRSAALYTILKGPDKNPIEEFLTLHGIEQIGEERLDVPPITKSEVLGIAVRRLKNGGFTVLPRINIREIPTLCVRVSAAPCGQSASFTVRVELYEPVHTIRGLRDVYVFAVTWHGQASSITGDLTVQEAIVSAVGAFLDDWKHVNATEKRKRRRA